MASKKSIFVSAPRLMIKVDGQTIAYAIGLNMNARMDVQPVMCLGSIKPVSLESVLAQPVSGTFQIVRLASASALQKRIDSANANKSPENTSSSASAASSTISSKFTGNNNKTIYEHLDPVKVLQSGLFDIEIYITGAPAVEEIVKKVTDSNGNIIKVTEEKIKDTGTRLFFKIQDCRVTSRATNIRMGSLLNEPISFQGLLATPTNDKNEPLFKLDEAVKEK